MLWIIVLVRDLTHVLDGERDDLNVDDNEIFLKRDQMFG